MMTCCTVAMVRPDHARGCVKTLNWSLPIRKVIPLLAGVFLTNVGCAYLRPPNADRPPQRTEVKQETDGEWVFWKLASLPFYFY